MIVLEKNEERIWRGEDVGCSEDPESCKGTERTRMCTEMNAGEIPGTLTSSTCGWSILGAAAQQEQTQLLAQPAVMSLPGRQCKA